LDGVLRIIDANLNRLREGLRVIEDTIRFINDDRESTLVLKEARHTLENLVNELPGGYMALLKSRDSAGDVGAGLNTDSEMTRRTHGEILTASFKRAQEAARVLEEYGKIFSAEQAVEIKKIRFLLYELEKELIPAQDNNTSSL
jgi:thiamine-phosphate pyrophosphorylase